MSKGYKDYEQAFILARRNGDNEPLHLKRAIYDGHRSLRLVMKNRDVGLATATYSYELIHEERCEVAERLAALWNLGAVLGLTTTQINALVESKTGDRDDP